MSLLNYSAAVRSVVSKARVDVCIAPVGFEEGAAASHGPPDATQRARSAAVALTELAAARAHLPREVIGIEHVEKGRPVIVPVRSLHASVSHCEDYVACAVSDQAIGIDIETCERTEADSHLAHRVCTREELEFLARLSPDRQRVALIRLWTRKEAVVKALGVGFAQPLERTDVLSRRPVIDGTRRFGRWICDVEECPVGYAAAVAGAGRGYVVNVRVVTVEHAR
jgi:4'-phosphopantetheinyl transferase